MHCENCGKNLKVNSLFCHNCGRQVFDNIKELSKFQASPIKAVNQSTAHLSEQIACQSCGAYAPVKYVEFYQNIGMLVMRQHKSIKGKLCKNCINKYFRNFTLTTLFLGWWGVISFFATVIFLINNIFRYLSTLTLKYI